MNDDPVIITFPIDPPQTLRAGDEITIHYGPDMAVKAVTVRRRGLFERLWDRLRRR